MCSRVNCKDYLCLGDDTLGAVLYKLEGEREGGLQASTTDSLLGTQLIHLSKQPLITESSNLKKKRCEWKWACSGGRNKNKKNLLFVETEQSRVYFPRLTF